MSSLKERAAARQKARMESRPFELPIPGYEDIGLWGRYRVLEYETLRNIGRSNENVADANQAELNEYADTIIRACVELLEREGVDENGNPKFRSLGGAWGSADMLRNEVGIDIPEGEPNARVNVFAVFNGPRGGNDLFEHFRAYSIRADEVGLDVAREHSGESEPSVEG